MVCCRFQALCSCDACEPGGGGDPGTVRLPGTVALREHDGWSSEGLGQDGDLLQALVVGLLVLLVGLDEDHTGRPFGTRRRTQVL